MGRIYEYFLQKFAISEGSGKGEFYTPKSIVRLIAELIQPYSGVIYDPCCGSGGMFVSSVKFIESHHGDRDLPTIYGQEYTPTTYKLAKMNLAIRGISANLGGTAADTFHRDQHPDLKADFIMANPPFNQKRWRGENELIQDARWAGYPVPPSGNANYGWILHIASKLTPNGAAGFLLANGALGGEDGDELAIRRKLIENDLVEAIFILPRELFYSTDISVTLWLLNRNKRARTFTRNGERVTHRDRTGEILFADLRTWGVEFEKKYITLADDEIARAAQLFHDWQQTGVESVPELCHSANLPEIKEKNYSLVPSKYISFLSRDASLDYDAEMETLRRSFSAILRDETAATAQLQSAFATLGYAIKGGIDK
jgi:type I restriction enzyme M protein